VNLRDLINELEDLAAEHGDQIEVRTAQQPRWAFEYSIENAVAVPARRKEPACVYLGEGRQIGYLPQAAAVALGWSSEREDEDGDEDDSECEDCGRERPSVEAREDLDDAVLCDACYQGRLAHGRAHLTAEERREACPGCGAAPGAGITATCYHPDGCGHWRAEAAAAEPHADDHTTEAGADDLHEDYPGQHITGPDFDTRDREGREIEIAEGGEYQIGSVDQYGLWGRDDHPHASDVGLRVTALRRLEAIAEGQAFEIWQCQTEDGRPLQLATYELVALSAAAAKGGAR